MQPREPQITDAVVPEERELDVLRRRLHDTTLQTLEYIASAGTLGAGADLERVMRLAAREATELRYLLEGVVGDAPGSLAATLNGVVEDARAFGGLRVELALGPMDDSLDRLTVVELGGAVREALTNVRKHARATRVTVYAEDQDGGAMISIVDDGRGADLSRASRGLGLAHSIMGRCQRLGGHAEVRSRPGEGFRVILRVGEKASEPAEPPLPFLR